MENINCGVLFTEPLWFIVADLTVFSKPVLKCTCPAIKDGCEEESHSGWEQFLQ